jgi:predicted ATPase
MDTIKSLRLINFKAFTDNSLELKPLTLLSGLNSTGKSCVLQSILLLRQSFQQGLLSEELALNGDLVSIGNGRDALNEYAEEDFIGFEITWDDEISAIWRYQYNYSADVLNLMSLPVNESILSANIFTDSFCYLSSCFSHRRLDFEILEQLPKGSLLLLEHPEFLLDARSQSRLGEQIALCASRGVQIILETHSDHLFNGIRIAVHDGKIKPEEVGFLHFELSSERKVKVTSAHINRSGRIDRWEKDFFCGWRDALSELLLTSS